MSANDFTYEPAGAGIRFLAVTVDAAIVSIASWIVNIPLVILMARMAGDPEQGMAVGLQIMVQVLNLALSGSYFGYFLSRKGATPGKSLFKLKVLHSETGAYVSFWRALGREALGKILCMLTFFIGYLTIIFRADKRGLHDLMFKTRVVRRKG